MSGTESTVDLVKRFKVIAIYRRVYGEDLLRAAQALCDGGVRLMEITFDQSDPDCIKKTAHAIRSLCDALGDKMLIGAGTVLSTEQALAARDAGAQYLISPNTDEKVIGMTKSLGLVSIPGAMTPTEILKAHDAGADFVKLFPAGYLGMRYVKDILAPINHVKLIATGGVNEENFGEYLAFGFAGAGVSGRLSQKDLIENGDFAELTRRAGDFRKIADEN